MDVYHMTEEQRAFLQYSRKELEIKQRSIDP